MYTASTHESTTRRWWHRISAPLLIAVTVVAAVTAPAAPSADASTEPTAVVPPYPGLELVHGTLFGWGPVAEQHAGLILPETPAPDTPTNRELIADVIDSATHAHPELLDDFQKAMYSGDREHVRSTTLRTLETLSDAAGITNNTGGGYEVQLISIANGKPHAVSKDRTGFEQWIDRVVAILGPAVAR